MKKRYILSAGAVGAIGAAAAGYFLRDQENRDIIKEKVNDAIGRSNKNIGHSTFEDAGIPGQVAEKDSAQRENSKMVSEGSQFGVQYYNEVKEENAN